MDLLSSTLAFSHKKFMPQIVAGLGKMRAILCRPGSNLKLGTKPSLDQQDCRYPQWCGQENIPMAVSH